MVVSYCIGIMYVKLDGDGSLECVLLHMKQWNISQKQNVIFKTCVVQNNCLAPGPHESTGLHFIYMNKACDAESFSELNSLFEIKDLDINKKLHSDLEPHDKQHYGVNAYA